MAQKSKVFHKHYELLAWKSLDLTWNEKLLVQNYLGFSDNNGLQPLISQSLPENSCLLAEKSQGQKEDDKLLAQQLYGQKSQVKAKMASY